MTTIKITVAARKLAFYDLTGQNFTNPSPELLLLISDLNKGSGRHLTLTLTLIEKLKRLAVELKGDAKNWNRTVWNRIYNQATEVANGAGLWYDFQSDKWVFSLTNPQELLERQMYLPGGIYPEIEATQETALAREDVETALNLEAGNVE